MKPHYEVRIFTRGDDAALAERFLVRQRQALERHGCATARVEESGEALSTQFLACFAAGEREPLGGLTLTLPQREDARLPIERVLESLAMLVPGERVYPASWRTGYVGSLWLDARLAGSGVVSRVMDAGFDLGCAAHMDCLVGLCSPHMLMPTLEYGFRVDRRFGRNGFFPYPDARYMSSVVYRVM